MMRYWILQRPCPHGLAVEQYDIDFLYEQPTDSRNLEAMCDLRRSTSIPIAANQGIWSMAYAAGVIRSEAGR